MKTCYTEEKQTKPFVPLATQAPQGTVVVEVYQKGTDQMLWHYSRRLQVAVETLQWSSAVFLYSCAGPGNLLYFTFTLHSEGCPGEIPCSYQTAETWAAPLFMTTLLFNWSADHPTNTGLTNSLPSWIVENRSSKNPSDYQDKMLFHVEERCCLAVPNRPLQKPTSAFDHFEVLLQPPVIPFLHHCPVQVGHEACKFSSKSNLFPFIIP